MKRCGFVHNEIKCDLHVCFSGQVQPSQQQVTAQLQPNQQQQPQANQPAQQVM